MISSRSRTKSMVRCMHHALAWVVTHATSSARHDWLGLVRSEHRAKETSQALGQRLNSRDGRGTGAGTHSLFARTPATTLLPLLPPSPTSMTLRRERGLDVLNVLAQANQGVRDSTSCLRSREPGMQTDDLSGGGPTGCSGSIIRNVESHERRASRFRRTQALGRWSLSETHMCCTPV